jgi:hypothetical protein
MASWRANRIAVRRHANKRSTSSLYRVISVPSDIALFGPVDLPSTFALMWIKLTNVLLPVRSHDQGRIEQGWSRESLINSFFAGAGQLFIYPVEFGFTSVPPTCPSMTTTTTTSDSCTESPENSTISATAS